MALGLIRAQVWSGDSILKGNRDEDGEKTGALQVMVKDFNLIHLNLLVIEVTERFLIRNKM